VAEQEGLLLGEVPVVEDEQELAAVVLEGVTILVDGGDPSIEISGMREKEEVTHPPIACTPENLPFLYPMRASPYGYRCGASSETAARRGDRRGLSYQSIVAVGSPCPIACHQDDEYSGNDRDRRRRR
jgi:hypothetical protein